MKIEIKEVKKGGGTFGASGRDSKARESSLTKPVSAAPKNDQQKRKPFSKTVNENLPPKVIKREPDKILAKTSAQIAKD